MKQILLITTLFITSLSFAQTTVNPITKNVHPADKAHVKSKPAPIKHPTAKKSSNKVDSTHKK